MRCGIKKCKTEGDYLIHTRKGIREVCEKHWIIGCEVQQQTGYNVLPEVL